MNAFRQSRAPWLGVIRTTRRCASTASAPSTRAAEYVFDAIPHWCALCCEPIGSWTEHVGKREHIALGMVFNAVVTAPRQWSPEEVWCDAEESLTTLCPRSFRIGAAARFRRRHHLPGYTHVPCADTPWHDMLHWYDKHDTAVGRRVVLHDLLQYWSQKGIFEPLALPSYFSSAVFHGTLVLFKDLFPPLASVFPRAAAKDISAMTQMVSTAFHLETLFDLCGMDEFVPKALLQTRQQVLPTAHTGVTPSSSPAQGAGPTVEDGRGRGSAPSPAADSATTLKANYVRAVLGLMRWAVEPHSLQTSLGTDAAGASSLHFPPQVPLADDVASTATAQWAAGSCSVDAVLATHTLQLIVSELITIRLAEYVSRVEPVVRETEAVHGGGSLEKMRAALRHQRANRRAAPVAPLVPPPSHLGALSYLQNDVVSQLTPFASA